MKVLTDVWKRKNKTTGKIEYIGAYKYYSGKSKKRELALITKSTYKFYKKIPVYSNKKFQKPEEER